MIKIRLQGMSADVKSAIADFRAKGFKISRVSPQYKNRGCCTVRVYMELQIGGDSSG